MQSNRSKKSILFLIGLLREAGIFFSCSTMLCGLSIIKQGEDFLRFEGAPVILNPKEGNHGERQKGETPAGS